MAAVVGVTAQDTGQDLSDLFNVEASHSGVPAELLVALAIAESELCVGAERWGRHTDAARAALAANDRTVLADVIATIDHETPGDISFGLFQQTVRWADEGDHSDSLDNVFAIRDIYTDPQHATAVAARKLAVFWRKFQEPLEALCRYNKPSLPGSQNPHQERYRESIGRARAYVAREETHAMVLNLDVKMSPNYSTNRRRTDGVVVHSTRGGTGNQETDYQATINWFLNPRSEVSAHVVVGPRRACRMVADADVAWHAGEHNGTHLGIEIAQPKPDTAYMESEYITAAAVVREWCLHYRIPMVHVTDVNKPGIIGHDETAQGIRVGKTDPGSQFDWDHFIALVNNSAPGPDPGRIQELQIDLGYLTGIVADRLQEALDGAKTAATDDQRDAALDALQAAINTLERERISGAEEAELAPLAPDVVIPLQYVTGEVATRLQEALDGARAAGSDAERADPYNAVQAAIDSLRRHH